MTINRLDLYAILGIPPSATQVEISHAYRVLLRRYHPDTRATDDEDRSAVSDLTLQQVLAAYTVLRDPARRAEYDRGAGRRANSTPRRSRQTLNHYRSDGPPTIVAGPVRWHRAPDSPSP